MSTYWSLKVGGIGGFISVELRDSSETLFAALNTAFDSYFPILLNYQNSAADGTLVPLAVREFYLNQLPISRLTLSPFVDAFTDAIISYPEFEAVLRADRERTYLYYFDYVSVSKPHAEPEDARIGVGHGEELFFLFPHPQTSLPLGSRPSDPLDMKMSLALVDLWTNFAKYRNPTPPDSCAVLWEPFSQDHKFFNISQFEMRTQSPFLPDRMAFWQAQPFPNRDDHFSAPPCRTPTRVD